MSTYSLSGAGIQLLTADTTALHVSITTLSPFGGIGNANPVNHYHQALIRPGDGTGFWKPIPIEGGPEWIGLPNGTDRIGYACEGGAVISVVEVIGGTSPFAGPPGSAGPAGGTPDFLLYQNRQTTNTHAGTATSGAWRTVPLNTEVEDVGGHGSISGNVVTLAAGTYRCHAFGPFVDTNGSQCRLRDTTNGVTLATGNVASASAGKDTTSFSFVLGTFTLSGSTAVELQYKCQTTQSTYGLGSAAGNDTEVYAQLALEKLA